jgi:hypothetical protein
MAEPLCVICRFDEAVISVECIPEQECRMYREVDGGSGAMGRKIRVTFDSTVTLKS